MANKAIYFTALKPYHGKNDEPVVLAGVRCRFRVGRHYEVLSRGNDALIEALAAEAKAGGIKQLTAAEAIPALEAQENADRKRKAAQKLAGPRVLPLGTPSATVE